MTKGEDRDDRLSRLPSEENRLAVLRRLISDLLGSDKACSKEIKSKLLNEEMAKLTTPVETLENVRLLNNFLQDSLPETLGDPATYGDLPFDEGFDKLFNCKMNKDGRKDSPFETFSALEMVLERIGELTRTKRLEDETLPVCLFFFESMEFQFLTFLGKTFNLQ